MSDPLTASMRISSSGLKAQSTRMRIVSENVANAHSTAQAPGGDPYRRKTVTFAGELDRAMAASLVRIKSIGLDKSAFRLEHDPSHPAADGKGYVKLPNVAPLIELADMREATRSYEANLNMIDQARTMLMRTIDMLRRG